MRRFLVLLLVLAPVAFLFFFWLRPDLDPVWHIPLFHFYIVTFVTFTAAVVSFLLIVGLGSVARPRHVLVAVAFAAMGSLFFTHGLSTPGALLPGNHPQAVAVGWSAWLTLFSGSVLFSLAGFNPPEGPSRRQANNILVLTLLAILAYVAVVLGAPHWLRLIESEIAPWHRLAIFYATLLLWLVAAFQLWKSWRLTHSRVDGALVFVALWMAQASISMHLFSLWHLSWWLYHFILLAGFLFTGYRLFNQYEQVRQFRLTRYYLAAALIMTALLALLASFLFTRFVQVVIETEAMIMTDVALQARAAGLFIAASTMGLLFISLLVVVRRAEGIITSRTAELAVAYRNLRHAETMRDDMTNMIIHDLRTPLTAIATSLSLLRHTAGTDLEMQAQIMERSERAIDRLDQMIDDILTVGKIETGELTPRHKPVTLRQLLTERLEPFIPQAQNDQKKVAVDCPPDLVVYLDPVLMGRVVDNLVTNAFKYTVPGGSIKVSGAATGDRLLLQVQDDGEGVPDDYKEHIFRKFGQVPQDDERPLRKGSGLGLAFCRLVAEVHGGTIWVEDVPGGGSDFKLQLPILSARAVSQGTAHVTA